MITNNIGHDNEHEFFGEWVPYSNEDEKRSAKIYLDLWKEIMIRKIAKDKDSNLEFVEDMLIDRPPYSFGEISLKNTDPSQMEIFGTLAIKLKFKGRIPRENQSS